MPAAAVGILKETFYLYTRVLISEVKQRLSLRSLPNVFLIRQYEVLNFEGHFTWPTTHSSCCALEHRYEKQVHLPPTHSPPYTRSCATNPSCACHIKLSFIFDS
jgi:hypothetical protein